MRRGVHDVGAIERALARHQEVGALTYVKPLADLPGKRPRSGWRVCVRGLSDYMDLTVAEAHALCVGLAAGERNGVARFERLLREQAVERN